MASQSKKTVRAACSRKALRQPVLILQAQNVFFRRYGAVLDRFGYLLWELKTDRSKVWPWAEFENGEREIPYFSKYWQARQGMHFNILLSEDGHIDEDDYPAAAFSSYVVPNDLPELGEFRTTISLHNLKRIVAAKVTSRRTNKLQKGLLRALPVSLVGSEMVAIIGTFLFADDWARTTACMMATRGMR